MLWEEAESTAEFTYSMLYLAYWWHVDDFKQLNSMQPLNLYQKKVISEAFAFLRSTAKYPVASRSRFIFLIKFHWQHWCLNSNQFRAQAAYFAVLIQCSPEWGSYFKLETMQDDNKYSQ